MALTKYTKARPTHGTFGPFPLRRIGFRSHPLSRSELLCIRFSETSLTTSLPILTHNSWRNPYLDSITRLTPIVEVSVHQECILTLVPRRLSPRRVESLSPLAELGQPDRHRGVFPSLLEPSHRHPTKINRMYPSPEALFLHRIPLPNFWLLKSTKKRSE